MRKQSFESIRDQLNGNYGTRTQGQNEVNKGVISESNSPPELTNCTAIEYFALGLSNELMQSVSQKYFIDQILPVKYRFYYR